MPKNTQGGKAYKKGKHSTGDDNALHVERAADQMYGRILKLLGGMNVKVFCNDNKERICHIRGKMRRRVYLREGDIVILSLRDLSTAGDKKVQSTICGGEGDEKGDILAKCDPKFYNLLKKDPTTNPKLFVDTAEKSNMEEQGGFEFGYNNEDGDEGDDEDSSSTESSEAPNTRNRRDNSVRHPAAFEDDADVDIDNI
jgi:translation initiation factor 1A